MSRNGEFNKQSGTPGDKGGVVLTQEQEKNRRARNLAIGVSIALFVVLFFFVTIVKLGGGAVVHTPG